LRELGGKRGGGVGGKGGGGGRGEKWPKPCMHIWIIKEKIKKRKLRKQNKAKPPICPRQGTVGINILLFAHT
jgi:hypothetical protein